MVTTSDLIPFASGSASIGVNQIGVAGFGNPVPYNHVHMNSGFWHDITGSSGAIRYANGPGIILGGTHSPYQLPALEFSSDGGMSFALRLGSISDGGGIGPHGFIQGGSAIENLLYIINSGTIYIDSEIAKVNIHGHEEIQVLSDDDIVINAASSINIDATDNVNSNVGVNYDVLVGRDTIITAGLIDTGGQIALNAFASSGRLQFRFGPHQGWAAKLTHSSVGGPANDGFWPIPHSGQISQMIAQATPGGTVDLQEAYDNGNEIDPRRDLVGYKGILVRETIPGFNGNYTSNPDITANGLGKYGIAVSGHTLTPNDFNSFGFSSLNSLALVIQSSGSVSALARSFFLGYSAGNPNVVFFNSDANLRFTVGDTTGPGTGGQIDFRPFGGSGRLDYRFGPYQAWNVRSSISTGGLLNDGYWPIAHSGNVNEMIARTPKSKAITIERPAVNNDLTIWYTNERIFITEVESVLRGGFDASGSFAIRHSTDRSQVGTSITTLPMECTNRTTGLITTSFVSQEIPADSWLWIGVSGVSGVATSQLNVTIQYLN